MVGREPAWQMGICISVGSDRALMPLKFRSESGWSIQSKFSA